MLSSFRGGISSNGNASSTQYLLMIGATLVSMKSRTFLRIACSSALNVSDDVIEVAVRRRKLFRYRRLECSSGGHFDLHFVAGPATAAGVSFQCVEHSEAAGRRLCIACSRFVICCWRSRLQMQMREMMAARVLETLCGDAGVRRIESRRTGPENAERVTRSSRHDRAHSKFGSSLRAGPRTVLFAVDLFDDIDRVSGRLPAQMLAQI